MTRRSECKARGEEAASRAPPDARVALASAESARRTSPTDRAPASASAAAAAAANPASRLFEYPQYSSARESGRGNESNRDRSWDAFETGVTPVSSREGPLSYAGVSYAGVSSLDDLFGSGVSYASSSSASLSEDAATEDTVDHASSEAEEPAVGTKTRRDAAVETFASLDREGGSAATRAGAGTATASLATACFAEKKTCFFSAKRRRAAAPRAKACAVTAAHRSTAKSTRHVHPRHAAWIAVAARVSADSCRISNSSRLAFTALACSDRRAGVHRDEEACTGLVRPPPGVLASTRRFVSALSAAALSSADARSAAKSSSARRAAASSAAATSRASISAAAAAAARRAEASSAAASARARAARAARASLRATASRRIKAHTLEASRSSRNARLSSAPRRDAWHVSAAHHTRR